jgi:hypothetical protein
MCEPTTRLTAKSAAAVERVVLSIRWIPLNPTSLSVE